MGKGKRLWRQRQWALSKVWHILGIRYAALRPDSALRQACLGNPQLMTAIYALVTTITGLVVLLVIGLLVVFTARMSGIRIRMLVLMAVLMAVLMPVTFCQGHHQLGRLLRTATLHTTTELPRENHKAPGEQGQEDGEFLAHDGGSIGHHSARSQASTCIYSPPCR